jgi:hypothetical protein
MSPRADFFKKFAESDSIKCCGAGKFLEKLTLRLLKSQVTIMSFGEENFRGVSL